MGATIKLICVGLWVSFTIGVVQTKFQLMCLLYNKNKRTKKKCEQQITCNQCLQGKEQAT
jgi:hypothetical protein